MYETATYRKYIFIKPEPHAMPHLAKDGSKQRIQEELNLYQHFKGDDRIEEIDGAYCLYMISNEWISRWRDFVQGRAGHPGPVYNGGLARIIHE